MIVDEHSSISWIGSDLPGPGSAFLPSERRRLRFETAARIRAPVSSHASRPEEGAIAVPHRTSRAAVFLALDVFWRVPIAQGSCAFVVELQALEPRAQLIQHLHQCMLA